MKTFILTAFAAFTLASAHAQGKFGGGNGDGYAMLQSSNVLLPVELVQFTVETHPEQGVVVRWTTAQEKNNRYFEVERSADGRTWDAIARENGLGDVPNGRLTYYHIVDRAALPGTSYYRLRQVDFDGTTTISRVATYRAAKPALAVQVFPNPTDGLLYLNPDGELPAGSLRLTDAVGTTLRSFASLPERVDLRALPPGVYFLHVGNQISKIIRQ